MAAFEHKDMTGSLFQNDRKTEDRHPHWKGKIMFGGKLYDIAGWEKDVNGATLISLKVSEPRPGPGQGQQPRQQPAQRPAYQSPSRPTQAQRMLNQPYRGEPELPQSAGTPTPEEDIPFAPNLI